MAGLLRRTRLTGIALALALGLTVLLGLVTPVLGDELASSIPGGPTEVLANESHGGGG